TLPNRVAVGLALGSHPLAFLEVELRLADELGIRRAVTELAEAFAQVDEPGAGQVERRGGALLLQGFRRKRAEIVVVPRLDHVAELLAPLGRRLGERSMRHCEARRDERDRSKSVSGHGSPSAVSLWAWRHTASSTVAQRPRGPGASTASGAP